MYQKPELYEVRFLRHGVTDNFLPFWTIFCPFTPLTTHKIEILKKWKKHLEMSSFYTYVPQIMIIWYMLYAIWSATDMFFVILSHFLPFDPPNNLKNENFEKMKKTPRYIILQLCITYDNHIKYGSWDLVLERQNLLFWAIFYPFTLLMSQKIKNSWIWRMMDIIFCHFGLFFALLLVLPSSLTTWKMNILKKWRKVWRYYHFAHV